MYIDNTYSGLLELCLDLNQNPNIPPELRFDVSLPNHPPRVSSGDVFVPPNLAPEEADSRILDYQHAMRQGKVTPLDVDEARAQINASLAAQGLQSLNTLEKGVSHPMGEKAEADVDRDLGFLSFEEEMEHLSRLDARLGTSGLPSDPRHRDVEQEKHYADLTPRELERKTEFENPQSQHNWLKTHTKVLGNDEDGDTESIASHDPASAASGGKTANKRKSAGKGNLAKQVGDRAVERAREGSTTAFSNDEDELASDAGVGSASAAGGGRRRAKDADGTYKAKGAKGTGARGKRKRSGEDMPGGAAGGKKARMESGAGTPSGASGLSGGMMGPGMT